LDTIRPDTMEKKEKAVNEKKGKKVVQEGKPLEVSLRRERACELYISGASVRQVSERLTALGYTNCKKSTIANDLATVLNNSAKNLEDTGKQILAKQVYRLDRLILTHWLPATQGNLKSGEYVRKLMADMSDLLNLSDLTKIDNAKPIENIHIKMTLEEWQKERVKRNSEAVQTLSLFEDFHDQENEK
jgi:hypothetical protein